MKKIALFVAMAYVAGLFAADAQARPDYVKGLKKAYADNSAIGEKNCGVCHGEGGRNKKKVNDYGKALGEALGAKIATYLVELAAAEINDLYERPA